MKTFVTFLYNWKTQSLNLSAKININVYFLWISFAFPFVASWIFCIRFTFSYFWALVEWWLKSSSGEDKKLHDWGRGYKFLGLGGVPVLGGFSLRGAVPYCMPCKKCWFFGKFCVRTKWMIPYQISNSQNCRISNTEHPRCLCHYNYSFQ